MYGTMNPSRDVVISGCSGGGKSSLIVELSRRGYPTVPEPGRRIVQEELRGDGAALPWLNLAAFAERAIAIASQDRESKADTGCWRFFDRGLVDAAVALEHSSARFAKSVMAAFEPYHRQVFLTPPWPEIYANDAERPQPFGEAVAEYERLAVAYRELGYDPILLPESSVSERATFVLDRLE